MSTKPQSQCSFPSKADGIPLSRDGVMPTSLDGVRKVVDGPIDL